MWHAGHVIVICHLLSDVCIEVLVPLQLSESSLIHLYVLDSWVLPRITGVNIFSIPWFFSVIHLMKNASNFALLLIDAQNLSMPIGSGISLRLIDTSVGSTVLLLILSKSLKPPAINVSG